MRAQAKGEEFDEAVAKDKIEASLERSMVSPKLSFLNIRYSVTCSVVDMFYLSVFLYVSVFAGTFFIDTPPPVVKRLAQVYHIWCPPLSC